jgi:hypothetical protein
LELILDIFLIHFPLQLKSGPSDYILVLKTWLRLHSEKIAEESKVGLDAHKGLPKMIKLKATKEIGGGEGQSPFHKVLKQNDFINIFLQIRLTERRRPLHNIFFLEEDPQKQDVSGVLTVCPIAICGLGFFILLVLISLGSDFLVSHP